MGFKNPIPDIDDVREAKRFIISPVFTYEQEMTLEEAAEGIERIIRDNGGKIPLDWVQFAERPKIRREEKNLYSGAFEAIEKYSGK